MTSRAPYPPHTLVPPSYAEAGVQRVNIPLNKGRVSDALRVFNGPCLILAMYMEITEAVANTACNMTWTFRSDKGGYRKLGDAVSIQAAALGDFFYAELDQTAIVACATGTGLITTGTTYGCIVTPGGIDIVLSANNLTSGKGTLYVWYKPLTFDANIVAEDWHTSTTSSSTTSSTSSTTSSTSSTTSTSSTASTTSSTSSTASTASSTSSTSSTASTTSSTSSTSSTASTTSSTSSTASTSSTTSTTTTA